MRVEICYRRRLTMLLINSLSSHANVVDKEALKSLVDEAEKQGVPLKELENGMLEITYRFVPREYVYKAVMD